MAHPPTHHHRIIRTHLHPLCRNNSMATTKLRIGHAGQPSAHMAARRGLPFPPSAHTISCCNLGCRTRELAAMPSSPCARALRPAPQGHPQRRARPCTHRPRPAHCCRTPNCTRPARAHTRTHCGPAQLLRAPYPRSCCARACMVLKDGVRACSTWGRCDSMWCLAAMHGTPQLRCGAATAFIAHVRPWRRNLPTAGIATRLATRRAALSPARWRAG